MRQSKISKLFEKEQTPLQKEVARLKEAGIELVDFSSDSTGIQVPGLVRNYCKRALDKRRDIEYSKPEGTEEYRRDIANYYEKRFNVKLNLNKNICASNGLKESLLRICSMVLNKNDVAAIPTPNRSSYEKLVLFCGGKVEFLPLTEENNFLPDLKQIPDKTKILFLTYPNNPTSATAPKEFHEKVYKLAEKFLVVVDESLVDLYYEEPQPSILEQGTKNILAITDLRYRSSMRDYNVGWVAGDENIISSLKSFSTKIPTFIQDSASIALTDEQHVKVIRDECKVKRNIISKALSTAGFKVRRTNATHYLWIKTNQASEDLAKKFLEKCVVVRPYDNGYVRFSLSPSIKKCKEAAEKIRELRV